MDLLRRGSWSTLCYSVTADPPLQGTPTANKRDTYTPREVAQTEHLISSFPPTTRTGQPSSSHRCGVWSNGTLSSNRRDTLLQKLVELDTDFIIPTNAPDKREVPAAVVLNNNFYQRCLEHKAYFTVATRNTSC
ncbi:hypothetical protein BaRGS_00017458 [Batillaria attramentaria]|uniref:Uncharacterized protein n=1 Tax=Batillaria attramentaria TaxID=370345 RepID=A0ABD0KVW4_9CAEN